MHAPDFKMLRRNSLHVEVDFGPTELDDMEDTVIPTRISMNECQMLKRVLGADKQDVLPQPCKTAGPATQNKSFMSRLTRVTDSPDVAGRLSVSECHNLSDTLKMMPGGSTFLPFACNAMLSQEEKIRNAKWEAQNEEVYRRVAKKNSYVAKPSYPPTAT